MAEQTITIEHTEQDDHEEMGLYPQSTSARIPLIMLKGKTLTLGREPTKRPSVTIADQRMSRDHAQLKQVTREVYRLFDCESKNGTWHNGEPADGRVVSDQDVLRLGNTTFVAAAYQLDNPRATSRLVGRSRSIHRLRELCRRVGPSDASVLIGGETGSGKEVTARELHDCSGRRGEFVAVNCGSIPLPLIERELFGHVKGAYTGAVQGGAGFVEAASRGTLFLDEIGELPLEAQAKLLRFLAEKSYSQIGSTTLRKADVRVLAATNRDLRQAIAAGTFREDLFARLEQVTLELPPLRARREDLSLLLEAAMSQLLGRSYAISPDCLEALALYDWPRNVRELFTIVQRIPLMRETELFELRDLPAEIAAPFAERLRSLKTGSPSKEALVRLLQQHRANVSAIAAQLNVDRKQVYRWLERFDLQPEAFRKPGS